MRGALSDRDELHPDQLHRIVHVHDMLQLEFVVGAYLHFGWHLVKEILRGLAARIRAVLVETPDVRHLPSGRTSGDEVLLLVANHSGPLSLAPPREGSGAGMQPRQCARE